MTTTFHYRVVWVLEQSGPVVDSYVSNDSNDAYQQSVRRFDYLSTQARFPGAVLFAAWQQLDADGSWQTLNTFNRVEG